MEIIHFTSIAICYFWNYWTVQDSTNFEFLQIIVENKVLLRNENLYKCNGFILLYFSYVFISTCTNLRNSDKTTILQKSVILMRHFKMKKKSHNFLNMQHNNMKFSEVS